MALSFLIVIFRSWSKCWWSMSSHVGCFSFEKHVTKVSATCFLHHLHQLRHIWRMLTAESAASLVRAFVTSRLTIVMSFSLDLRRSSPTNCKLWWMQQPAAPHSDWYEEVWRRLDAADAWQSPLAWRASSALCIKSSSWLVAVSSVPRLGIWLLLSATSLVLVAL